MGGTPGRSSLLRQRASALSRRLERVAQVTVSQVVNAMPMPEDSPRLSVVERKLEEVAQLNLRLFCKVEEMVAKERAPTTQSVPRSGVRSHRVIEVVARERGLRPVDLLSRSNAHMVAHARQIAMYLIKKHCGLSFPQIGKIFGGKHHTTVMHSVRKLAHLIVQEPEAHLVLELNAVEAELLAEAEAKRASTST